jgi:thioredoxin-related protein
MRTDNSTNLLVAAAGIAMLFLSVAAYAEAQSIAWRTDLESADAEAKQTGKMMMVDVYTDWCEWCKVLDTKTYTDAKVIAGAQQFVPLKLNPEKSTTGAQFAKRYSVSGYPTVLFVEWDGTLVSRVEGFVDAPSFATAITRTVQNGPKVKSYLAEFNSGGYRNSQELISMLVEMGRVDEAIPVFDHLRSTASLPTPFQEKNALAMGSYLLEQNQLSRGLEYLKIVEDIDSGSDATWDAHRLHAIAIYYTKGKTVATEYLDLLLAKTNIPVAWKDRYKDLETRIKAAKDQGGS